MKFNSIKLGEVVAISQIPFLKSISFSCWKRIQELLTSLVVAFFFLPQKKNPYVASTKRIVYAFLSECQEEKNQKTKPKPFLNLLL